MTADAKNPTCPRCGSVALQFRQATTDTAYYQCPSCRRDYMQKGAGSLTFGRSNPMFQPLFTVRSEPDPEEDVGFVADMVTDDMPLDAIGAMLREIAAELAQPSQQVREIAGNVASEEKCRKFLAAFSAAVQAKMKA
jgi:hypothetical protein